MFLWRQSQAQKSFKEFQLGNNYDFFILKIDWLEATALCTSSIFAFFTFSREMKYSENKNDILMSSNTDIDSIETYDSYDRQTYFDPVIIDRPIWRV